MSKSIDQMKEEKRYDIAVMRRNSLNLYYRPSHDLPTWFVDLMKEEEVPTASDFQPKDRMVPCTVTPDGDRALDGERPVQA